MNASSISPAYTCGLPTVNSLSAWSMNSQLYHALAAKAQRIKRLDSLAVPIRQAILVKFAVHQHHHKENMEPEPVASTSSHKLSYVFYNDRGLRTGWRLLIYFGMIFVLVFGARLVARRLGSGDAKSAPPSDFARTILQAIAELV